MYIIYVCTSKCTYSIYSIAYQFNTSWYKVRVMFILFPFLWLLFLWCLKKLKVHWCKQCKRLKKMWPWQCKVNFEFNCWVWLVRSDRSFLQAREGECWVIKIGATFLFFFFSLSIRSTQILDDHSKTLVHTTSAHIKAYLQHWHTPKKNRHTNYNTVTSHRYWAT